MTVAIVLIYKNFPCYIKLSGYVTINTIIEISEKSIVVKKRDFKRATDCLANLLKLYF